MKKLLIFSIVIFIFFSCANNTSHSESNSSNKVEKFNSDSNSFFPVTGFLKGQMLLLDSAEVTFLQVNTHGNKSDSLWISREKIRPLLKPFIEDISDDKNLVSFFKESKFNDQTTSSITLTYDPKTILPDSISLHHCDIYIDPGTGAVKRVYLLKQIKENERFYTRQLTWQAGKWARIVTILNNPDGSSEIQADMKIQWDLSEL